MYVKAKALAKGSLTLRTGGSTLISKDGTCDLLSTVHLTAKDSIIRDIPLQEGDSPKITMCKCRSRTGMQTHNVRSIKPGTSMMEMTTYELTQWLVTRVDGILAHVLL